MTPPSSPFALAGPTARALLLGYVTALVVCAAVASRYVPHAGLSGADEPSHFLNAYFIHRWLAGDFGWQPMRAAIDFYLHYPKLALGQWPPLHYAVAAGYFALAPATPASAFVFNALVAATPALFVAAVVHRFVNLPAAVLACAWYAALPLVVQASTFLMTEQAVAAWSCAAAAVWVSLAARPRLGASLGFAALAVAAILTKGSGWLVGLMAVFHIALTGRWKLALDWRLWIAAACALALLLPWQWVAARIASDSWAFRPGLDYATQALLQNAAALAGNLGPLGSALAAVGAVSAWRTRVPDPRRWDAAAVCVAVVAATLTLHALVPASLEARFMAPALPALVVLAVLGAAALAGRVARHVTPRRAAAAFPVLGFVLTLPATLHLARELPKVDLRAADAAAHLVSPAQTAAAILVVDGGAGAEGALIAEVAVRDAARRHYVVRSSQLLSESSWTGQRYRLRAETPQAVARQLGALGAAGVVTVHRAGESPMPHSVLLGQALRAPESPWRLVARLEHAHRSGATEVWRAAGPVAPDMSLLRAASFPSKAGALGAERGGSGSAPGH